MRKLFPAHSCTGEKQVHVSPCADEGTESVAERPGRWIFGIYGEETAIGEQAVDGGPQAVSVATLAKVKRINLF